LDPEIQEGGKRLKKARSRVEQKVVFTNSLKVQEGGDYRTDRGHHGKVERGLFSRGTKKDKSSGIGRSNNTGRRNDGGKKPLITKLPKKERANNRAGSRLLDGLGWRTLKMFISIELLG